MLAIGSLAPDFELPDQDGRQVRLSALLGHGRVLLYFYPADFTPVCTREACAFRNWHSQLLEHATQICGISPQGSGTHARFRRAHALPFTLLSDTTRQVIRAYECAGPWGIGVRRTSYLIEHNGRILDVAHAAFRVRKHVAMAIRALGTFPDT